MLLVAGLLLVGAAGPFDIALLSTTAAPNAAGRARLYFRDSPFGVSVTPEGVGSYNVRVEADGLPAPASLGGYAVYLAWAATPDLSTWHRLGTVSNGTSTVGPVTENKFLFVVTAESDSTSATRTGPTVLHGISPSSWLQSLLSHALFRGIPPG